MVVLSASSLNFSLSGKDLQVLDFIESQASKKAIKAAVFTITPALAKYFVSDRLPENQRKLNDKKVFDYSKRILAGEWKIGDGLLFNDRQELFDGQHRCSAVVKSGIPTDFVVVAGYPPDSMSVVDIGMSRTTSNIASVLGHSWIKTQHVAISIAMNFNVETGSSRPNLSEQAKIDFILKNKEAIAFASRTYGDRYCLYGPVRAAIARAYYHENHNRLAEFVECFDREYPLNSGTDEAAVALRRQHRESVGLRSGGASVRLEFFARSLAAVNAFCKNERRSFNRATSKNLYPLPANVCL